MELSAPRADTYYSHFIRHGRARAICYAACALCSPKLLWLLATKIRTHCSARQWQGSEAATVGSP